MAEVLHNPTKRDERRIDTSLRPDELARQVEAVEKAENALTVPPPPPDQETRLAQLEADNARLSQVITRAIEARNSAVAFANRWNDPRRLPALIDEVRKAHPDVQKIAKENGAVVAGQAASIVAQVAISYQIEALINGMIYAWVDNGKLIVEIGIRGYRQMLMQRGIDWQTPRPMTPEERALHGLKPDDHGAICQVFDWAREERFKAHGQVADPIIGVGVWRALNLRNKADNIPAGRSAQWVAEKNAHKDAARSILPMPVFDVANIQKADFEANYDAATGAWEVPIRRADWLEHPDVVKKFELLLHQHGITDEELNAALGHDWHTTSLDREEMSERVNELIAARTAIQPETPPAVVTPPTSAPKEIANDWATPQQIDKMIDWAQHTVWKAIDWTDQMPHLYNRIAKALGFTNDGQRETLHQIVSEKFEGSRTEARHLIQLYEPEDNPDKPQVVAPDEPLPF